MTVRSARAVRPPRPITLPRSSGCTRTSRTRPRRSPWLATLTSSGWSTMPLTRCSSASWSTSGAAVLARVLGPGARGGGYGRWLGCAVCLAVGGVARLGGSRVLATCALGRVLGCPGLGGRVLAAARLGRGVLGRCVLGGGVLGRCVLACCVLGCCVFGGGALGWRVFGGGVLGRCIFGGGVLGRCVLGRVLGRCVFGGGVLGCRVLGRCVFGGGVLGRRIAGRLPRAGLLPARTGLVRLVLRAAGLVAGAAPTCPAPVRALVGLGVAGLGVGRLRPGCPGFGRLALGLEVLDGFGHRGGERFLLVWLGGRRLQRALGAWQALELLPVAGDLQQPPDRIRRLSPDRQPVLSPVGVDLDERRIEFGVILADLLDGPPIPLGTGVGDDDPVKRRTDLSHALELDLDSHG